MGYGESGTAFPEHNVSITRGYYLGKYEVTQAEYQAVMAGNEEGLSANPSNFGGFPDRPVEKVSYDDIIVFLERLNETEAPNLPDGWSYELPTEAQWEFAARADTTTAYPWGDTIVASDANWNHGNDANQTEDVGNYAANPWGFFDMQGNVWEWVADRMGDYTAEPKVDPEGPSEGDNFATRGGSFDYDGEALRSFRREGFHRTTRYGHVGFRLSLRYTNIAPTDLNSTDSLTVAENELEGTLVGEFNATDPEGAEITYHLVSGEGFTLEENGTLLSNKMFDYEMDDTSYTLVVQARDEKNASVEGTFTVTIEDIFEDLDDDGTADHLDEDMDGDGFSNDEEKAIGSNPISAEPLSLNDSNFFDAIELWFAAERNARILRAYQ